MAQGTPPEAGWFAPTPCAVSGAGRRALWCRQTRPPGAYPRAGPAEPRGTRRPRPVRGLPAGRADAPMKTMGESVAATADSAPWRESVRARHTVGGWVGRWPREDARRAPCTVHRAPCDARAPGTLTRPSTRTPAHTHKYTCARTHSNTHIHSKHTHTKISKGADTCTPCPPPAPVAPKDTAGSNTRQQSRAARRRQGSRRRGGTCVTALRQGSDSSQGCGSRLGGGSGQGSRGVRSPDFRPW